MRKKSWVSLLVSGFIGFGLLWMLATSIVLLAGCGRDTETRYVTTPAAEPAAYTVKAEVRECDGNLTVDFASLESDGVPLRATNATTRKTAKGEWEIVLEFRK